MDKQPMHEDSLKESVDELNNKVESGSDSEPGEATGESIENSIEEEGKRQKLASHHHVHHHHSHHRSGEYHTIDGHRNSGRSDSFELGVSEAVPEIKKDVAEIEGVTVNESNASVEQQKQERIPLAAHHRVHRHRRLHNGTHHRHRSTDKSGHRTKRFVYYSDLSNNDLTTVKIDMEEFERLQAEEAKLENKINEAGKLVENHEKKTDENIETVNIMEEDSPRLMSAILSARENNLHKTRRASTIKSTGSYYRDKKNRRKAFIIKTIVGILIAIAVFLFGGIIGLIYMRSHGQATMMPKAEEVEIVIPEEERPEEVEKVEDDGKTITYKGQKYRWNENVTTILFLGTDRSVEQQEEGETMAGINGQADTILLGVIDNMNRKISFININRDTFIPVAEYTPDGDYAGEKKMQICLSYAYGKDNEQSCRYTAAAVSKYLFGMPVDYFVRISYDAIPILNDSVGGITVTVPEDMTMVDADFVPGATVTLMGNQAATFVRWRNREIVETNEYRILRQKQYLKAFMRRTLDVTKSDITLPLGLYANAKPYMTTNITMSQVTYLTSKVLEYGIEDDAIHGIPGQSFMGEGEHVEFYPDQTAVYEQVLETFYNKVENN